MGSIVEFSRSEEDEPPNSKNVALVIPKWKEILSKSISSPHMISHFLGIPE
jgi:hypothetical protein